jgi:hypothetical protein
MDGQPVSGARCNLKNDKGEWFVTTPGSVTIRKAYGDLSIDCKKDQAMGTRVFKSVNETAVWGNLLAGGIVGYAVDAGTGAGFSYPSSMSVELTLPGSGTAAKVE